MKTKKIFFILLIFFTLFNTASYGKTIKKINEMTANELIEYNIRVEEEKTERNKTQNNLIQEANKKFDEQYNKQQSKKNNMHIVIFVFLILLYLVSVYFTNKNKLNKTCVTIGALLIIINLYTLLNITPIYTYDTDYDELTNLLGNICYAIGLNFSSLIAVIISYISFFINKNKNIEEKNT